METKMFVLIVAQRFAEDADGLLAQIREELESVPDLKEELKIIRTQDAGDAIFYAKREFRRQLQPAILVITGGIYSNGYQGGMAIGKEMEMISVPVWMYSNLCTGHPGIERFYAKYGGSNPTERVGEGRLARDIVSHFMAFVD